MKLNKLTSCLSVCPQITVGDVTHLQKLGFGTIICNRPDSEANGQPEAASIGNTATAAGLKFLYIPITPGQFSEQQVAQFASALAGSESPVLAYCRTGARSATLWALSQAGKQSVNHILARAANAGYDLGKLAGHLDEIANDQHELRGKMNS